MGKKYNVVFYKNKCIGAAACVAVHPDGWRLDEDAKAELIGSKPEGENYVLEIDESQLEHFKESADVCPVAIIHIYDSDGKKIYGKD